MIRRTLRHAYLRIWECETGVLRARALLCHSGAEFPMRLTCAQKYSLMNLPLPVRQPGLGGGRTGRQGLTDMANRGGRQGFARIVLLLLAVPLLLLFFLSDDQRLLVTPDFEARKR
jgi:hypothetical protein